MTLTYTKLAADGSDLPADATDHLAVRIDRDLLTRPIILTAHRSPEPMSWADAKAWAERLDTYGWSWRLPTIEEAVMLVDYSRTAYPLLPPEFFPDCEGEWIWTSTEDLTPRISLWHSSGCARCVDLGYGDSGIVDIRQGGRVRVRAVRALLPEEKQT